MVEEILLDSYTCMLIEIDPILLGVSAQKMKDFDKSN